MADAKPVASTLPTNCKLSRKQILKSKIEKVEMMKVPYAMVCTRLDIRYVVVVVNRFIVRVVAKDKFKMKKRMSGKK